MHAYTSESEAFRQFSQLQAAFLQAREQCRESASESFFRFGGHLVRALVVGKELARTILQPFAHLETAASSHDPVSLDINLWDETETHIQCRGETESGLSGTQSLVTISAKGRFVRERTPNTLIALDRARNHIAGSVLSGDRLQGYEQAKPLARLLVEWYWDHGLQVVHAGFVARGDAGVLLGGMSGSGKSTAALLCALGGYDFLGEDYVGLRRQQEAPFIGYSLYGSLFLGKDVLERRPDLRPIFHARGDAEEGKLPTILSIVLPRRMRESAPVSALALCRVTSKSTSRVRRASGADALRTLGVSSLFQIPNRGRRSFDELTSLVEHVPCFWLEMGWSLDTIAGSVDELLAQAAAGTGSGN